MAREKQRARERELKPSVRDANTKRETCAKTIGRFVNYSKLYVCLYFSNCSIVTFNRKRLFYALIYAL